VELGKKSILDGLGLALAGSKAATGTICRKYLQTLGVCGGKSVVIGSNMHTSPRFAAFINGVSLQADDFDDCPYRKCYPARTPLKSATSKKKSRSRS